MDTTRNRRRFVIVAAVIWAMTIPFLFFLVPPQPRLVIRTAGPSSIIGTTSDSRTMYTSCIASDDDARAWRRGWSPSGLVQAWDLATGREVTRIQLAMTASVQSDPSAKLETNADAKARKLTAIIPAPGGQAFAYVYGETNARLGLWSVELNREVLCLDGASIGRFHFSPDGKWFALRGPTGSSPRVRVFASATGAELRLEDSGRQFEEFGGCAFSSDGRFFAISEGTQNDWATATWSLDPLRRLGSANRYGFLVAVASDGKRLATVGQDRSIRLTELDTGKTHLLKPHDIYVSALAFTSDNQSLIAYSALFPGGRPHHRLHHRTTTWEAATGRLLQSFVPPAKQRICYNPNEPTIDESMGYLEHDATCAPRILVQPDESNCCVFDAIENQQIAALPKDVLPVRVSEDNRMIVTHERRETWLRQREGLTHWLQEHVPGFAKIWPNRRRLQLWDLTTSSEIASFESDANQYRFTADSKTLITSNRSDRIEVWDVPPGWPIKTILAWSLPLPVFVLLVGEWRFRRRRKRRLLSAAV